MKRALLLLILAFASLSTGARQEPPPPPHTPEACTRPAAPRKGHVVCGTCKLECDEHGQRIEQKDCPAYCRISLCRCHEPCCNGHEDGTEGMMGQR